MALENFEGEAEDERSDEVNGKTNEHKTNEQVSDVLEGGYDDHCDVVGMYY